MMEVLSFMTFAAHAEQPPDRTNQYPDFFSTYLPTSIKVSDGLQKKYEKQKDRKLI